MNRRDCLGIATAALTPALPPRVGADAFCVAEACKTGAAFAHPLPVG